MRLFRDEESSSAKERERLRKSSFKRYRKGNEIFVVSCRKTEGKRVLDEGKKYTGRVEVVSIAKCSRSFLFLRFNF